ncbi:MAG: toll/interleukin-1 receptor domain-containing protein [Bryobacteraceae bacterium]
MAQSRRCDAMPNVFISYSHVSPDQDLARQLAGSLEANGVTVFLDTKIRIGEDWVEQIDRQLRISQYFVVLLSAASIQSDMVRREIVLAYKLRKAKQLTILPVRMDATRELPYDIGAYLDLIQYVVWNPGESFDPICRTILQAITAPEKAVMPMAAQASVVTRADDSSRHSGTAESATLKAFDRAELERAKEQLAVYVGPLARMIVDRAAKRAANWRELYDILAAEVPAGEERKKFLSHLRH